MAEINRAVNTLTHLVRKRYWIEISRTPQLGVVMAEPQRIILCNLLPWT